VAAAHPASASSSNRAVARSAGSSHVVHPVLRRHSRILGPYGLSPPSPLIVLKCNFEDSALRDFRFSS